MRTGLREPMSLDAVGSGCRSYNLRQKIIIVDKHLIESIYKLVKVQLNCSSCTRSIIKYIILFIPLVSIGQLPVKVTNMNN